MAWPYLRSQLRGFLPILSISAFSFKYSKQKKKVHGKMLILFNNSHMHKCVLSKFLMGVVTGALFWCSVFNLRLKSQENRFVEGSSDSKTFRSLLFSRLIFFFFFSIWKMYVCSKVSQAILSVVSLSHTAGLEVMNDVS